MLVIEGDDETEALTVRIEVNKLNVRLVVWYGACESNQQTKKYTTKKDRKLKLWDFIE